ncbi:MAG: HAD-IB family phosphatase [Minisyncoccales bacterium]
MKKIICFDVNGTLVEGKTWDLLVHGRKDVGKEIEDNFNLYYKKEIGIDEAWSGLVSILKRAGMSSREYLNSRCGDGKDFKEGAEDILSYLKQKGYKIYLVSCSIDIHLDSIVARMNLDGRYAGSHLIFDDAGELVSIKTDCIKEGGFKKECLEDLARKEEVDIKDIIFVGDGNNDIGPFEMTGHGIAIGNNKELIDVSWKQIEKLPQIKEFL